MLKELESIVERHDLISRSYKSFWNRFKKYHTEESKKYAIVFGDLRPEELELWLEDVRYVVLDWPMCHKEQIVIYIDIVKDDSQKGYYTVHYSMEGEKQEEDIDITIPYNRRDEVNDR